MDCEIALLAMPEPFTAPDAVARLWAVAAVGSDNCCGNNDMDVSVPAHAAPAAPAPTRAAPNADDRTPSSLAVDVDTAPLVAPVPTDGRTAAAPDPAVGRTAAAAGAPDPAARTSCTSPARLLGL